MFVPVSNKHSISRVIATIFLPQSLIKPERVYNNLNSDLPKYQKKSLSKGQTINLGQNSLQISGEEVLGFLFEEFNNLGNSINIFKVENINNNTKAIILFETKDYIRWENFRERFFDDLDKLATTFDTYFEAISLNYIDEFIWNSVNKIPVDEIFNLSSGFFNEAFATSHNGTLISITQSPKAVGVQFEEEKSELLFNNDIKRVILNHTFAIKLDEIKEYNSNLIKDLFEKAHLSNKAFLEKVLTTKVIKTIGLLPTN